MAEAAPNPSAVPAHDRTRSFHLRVFGCQMNFYDGELIRAAFVRRGYREAADPDGADVVLFHTCSVREHAEERVHGLLGELRRRKRSDPGVIVGVVGCMADREGLELFEREPHVDIVCGSRHFPHLPSFVDRVRGGEERVLEVGAARAAVDQPLRDLAGRPHSWSAHVAVMRGCDLNCTYCIVPSVRGRVASRPPQEIVDEVRRLVDHGVTEVNLLGQTIDAYGRDLPRDGRPSLGRLLDQLAELEALLRVRLITLHPSYVDSELARAMARSPQFLRLLPIPLQSGSDSVLKRMKRGYDTGLYRKRIDLLKQEMPDLELVSDWIVGFPGESDAEFADSERLMQEIGFLHSFVFQYSPRPGTSAYALDDDVPAATKKERNQRLLELQRRIARQRSARFVGTDSRMLLEQPDRDQPDAWSGRSHNGHPCSVAGAAGYQAGQLLPVHLQAPGRRGLQALALGPPRPLALAPGPPPPQVVAADPSTAAFLV